MTVGEVAVGGKGDFKVYTSAKEEELNMMFNFKHLPRSRARYAQLQKQEDQAD